MFPKHFAWQKCDILPVGTLFLIEYIHIQRNPVVFSLKGAFRRSFRILSGQYKSQSSQIHPAHPELGALTSLADMDSSMCLPQLHFSLVYKVTWLSLPPHALMTRWPGRKDMEGAGDLGFRLPSPSCLELREASPSLPQCFHSDKRVSNVASLACPRPPPTGRPNGNESKPPRDLWRL